MKHVTIATIVIAMISELQYVPTHPDHILVNVKNIMSGTGLCAKIEKNVKIRKNMIAQYTQIVSNTLVVLNVTVNLDFVVMATSLMGPIVRIRMSVLKKLTIVM